MEDGGVAGAAGLLPVAQGPPGRTRPRDRRGPTSPTNRCLGTERVGDVGTHSSLWPQPKSTVPPVWTRPVPQAPAHSSQGAPPPHTGLPAWLSLCWPSRPLPLVSRAGCPVPCLQCPSLGSDTTRGRHSFLPWPGPGRWRAPHSAQAWHTGVTPTQPSGAQPQSLVTEGIEEQSGRPPPQSKGEGTHSLTWTGEAVRGAGQQAAGGHGGRWQSLEGGGCPPLPPPLVGGGRGGGRALVLTDHCPRLRPLDPESSKSPSPRRPRLQPLCPSRPGPQRGRRILQGSGQSRGGPRSPGVSRCHGPQSPL